MADTEPSEPLGHDSPGLEEAGQRGSLKIADRVIEHVAVLAARQVPGVTVVGSALKRSLGVHFPRAEAHVAGRRVRVVVQLAVIWPSALPVVSAQVRDTVRERVSTLVGMHVDAVDVVAAKIVHAVPTETRRVQ